jgi:hypothetical protein
VFCIAFDTVSDEKFPPLCGVVTAGPFSSPPVGGPALQTSTAADHHFRRQTLIPGTELLESWRFAPVSAGGHQLRLWPDSIL